MQPIPLPENIYKNWLALGWRRTQVNPPPDTDIWSVQALVGQGEYGAEFNILVQISEEDRRVLEMNGWRFWYTVHTGQLAPFRFTLLGEDGSNEALTDDELAVAQRQYEEALRAQQLPGQPLPD